MSGDSAPFIDTNVLLYLLSSDKVKSDRAEKVLADGGVISVQVLNEMANVMSKKLKMSWSEMHEVFSIVRNFCRVINVNIEVHDIGLHIAETYKISLYDSMIVAAAVTSGCATLLSEDMHNGLVVEKKLTISNPFL